MPGRREVAPPGGVRGGPRWLRRLDAWASSGRLALPVIVLVVGIANLVGVASVTLLLVGVTGGVHNATGRVTVLLTAAGYLVVTLPVATVYGRHRQRPIRSWLIADREPTRPEAAYALRLPLETALLTTVLWLVGALVTGVVAAASFPDPWIGLRIGVAVALGGAVTAGVSYLLTARIARGVTARALAAHPPSGPLALSVRARLLLVWSLTSGVPLLGVILLFFDPSNPQRPSPAAVVFLVAVAILVGALATVLNARAVGQPLRQLRDAVQQVGHGDYEARVTVDDAGEIGLLQNGVNAMAAGLAERERLRDLFGRHVGTTVAEHAVESGVELGGEVRTAAALFVDIAGSTTLVRHTGPEEMVGLLNRFFAVVVEAVGAEGGLVNKFEGDASLCVFGAPVELDDPAGAALRAARRICDAVAAAGEVDVGVGVSCGRVWAGHVGAASRLEYTVIGDPVNEAARLTELAKDQPGRVVASDAAVEGAAPDERRHWTRGAVVRLRGRDEPTGTWVRRRD